MWRRARGEPAGQRRVRVDVELEQVEEGVVDKGDRTVKFAFDAVVKFERAACLIADGERDPLELMVGELDVFACFSGGRQRFGIVPPVLANVAVGDACGGDLRAPVHTLDPYRCAVVV